MLTAKRPDREPTRILGEGRFLRLVNASGWEYAERIRSSGVVAVVAVTREGELVLTEQHRPAVGCRVIDLPAGLAGDLSDAVDESMETAAQRELVEETGYVADHLKRLARVPTSPGLTSETVQVFLATGVTKVSAGGGDAGESITVRLLPLEHAGEQLLRWSSDDCFIDPKVYLGLWFIQQQPSSDG